MRFLEGIRVLDCTRLLPGPFASLFLADMGAEVIKVEEPETGDYMRRLFCEQPDSDSPLFQAVNRNKKSITLNLKAPAGRQIFLDLVRSADVVLEGFRPGVADRLGIGYEDCVRVNSRIVYASLTGWGQSGPYAHLAGHDLNYLSISGLLTSGSAEDGKPVLMGTQIADLNGAWQAVIGILGALFRARRDDKPCFLDVSMLDGVVSWETLMLAHVAKREQQENHLLVGGTVCYNVYPTKDGKWVSLGCIEHKFWNAFCHAAGHPEWVERQHEIANGTGFHREVIELFRVKTRDEWADIGQTFDCCLFPVLEQDEISANAHVSARELLYSRSRAGHTREVRFPVKLMYDDDGVIPIADSQEAPELSSHTHEILQELGYSEAQMKALQSERIV